MFADTIPNLCGRGSEWAISGAAWDWGPSSRALTYDGTDDYAGLDESVISGYPFTVIVQFKTTSTTAANRCIFSQSNSTDANHKLGIRLNSSHQPQCFVGSNVVTFTEAANDGIWHTVAMLAEADGTVHVYYDGGIGGSVAGGTFPTLDRSTLGAIRSATTTEYFAGSIARLIIVEAELDTVQIHSRIDDPAAWRLPPRLELLFEPVVEVEPFFPILLPGGWPGQMVSRSHPQAHRLEGWFPLTHPVDQNSVRSLIGNVEAVPLGGAGAVLYESEGRFGGRLRFDGVNGRVVFSNSPGHFHFANGQSITISAWITPDTSDRRNVIVRQDGDGFSQVNYSFASGGTGFPNRLDFFFRTSESGGITHVYRSNEDYIQFGVEQHVAVTLTFGDVANTIQLFHNGEPVEGSFHFGDGAGTVFSGAGDLIIGQHSSADRFDGAIADIRIIRTLADATLIRNIIERPWDAIVRPHWISLVADKMVSVGVASDFASAFGIEHFKLRLLEQPATSDTGFSIASNREYGIQLIAEVDTALSAAMWKAMELALNLESDSSLAFTRQKTFSISVTSDSEVALPATVRRLYLLGQPSEGDSAFDFTMTSGYLLGIAGEVGAALDFTMSFGSPLGIASEGDSAQSLMIDKIVPFEMAGELDSVHEVFITRTYTLELAAETTLASDWTVTKIKEIGVASESDFAFLMLPVGVLFLGIDFEALGTHMDASAPRQTLDASSTQWSR